MKLARWLIALVATAVLTAQARADGVVDFYKGKQITLIVSYGPGGGYDSYSRLFAKHMSKYIPGNPTIVIQHMPGAGSLKGTNYIYNVAPRDGTAFGTFARNMPLLALLKTDQNVQFDPLKFTWLGSSSSFANDAYVLVARKDATVKSVDDARKPGGAPLILGNTGEGTSSDAMPTVLREMLGFNLKSISGYTDSGTLNLAMDRGEIEGRTGALSSIRANKPDWLKTGGPMQVLLVFGRKTRFPDFPNAPTAGELARTPQDKELIELLELPYMLSRPFAAPPDVPAERAAALKKAFMDTHKDPAFLKEAVGLGLDVSPIDGDEVLRLITGISKLPEDRLKSVEKLVGGSGG